MKKKLKILIIGKSIFMLFILAGCSNPIERSGVVIDKQTKEPIQDVSVEIYMKNQKRDSLKEKVFTDANGHFHIKEKRDEDLLFLLYKNGYIGYTSSISIPNDTIIFERDKALNTQ